MNYRDQIQNSSNLDELCDILNNIAEENRYDKSDEYQDIDFSSLPVFSQNEPKETEEIWSYDESRLLVDNGNEYEVIDRCSCGEASFHCGCDEDFTGIDANGEVNSAVKK